MQIDLSPISLRALWNCRSLVGITRLAQHYDIDNMSVLFRLAGAGYRVRARMLSTTTKRWSRLRVIAGKPFRSHSFPLELWLGCGAPLNPYLRGKMIVYLRKELKPKEIRLVPNELLFDGEREILERTVIRNWVEQWLRWVSWYHTVALSPDVSIDTLLYDAPICASSWKRSNLDPNVFQFGLVWKLYDMGVGWSLSTTPPWVLDPATVIQIPGWILGGYSGSDFLLAPVDLPSTGR